MRARRCADPDSPSHNAGAEQVADCPVCNCDVEDRQTIVVGWGPLFVASECLFDCQCGSAQVSFWTHDVAGCRLDRLLAAEAIVKRLFRRLAYCGHRAAEENRCVR